MCCGKQAYPRIRICYEGTASLTVSCKVTAELKTNFKNRYVLALILTGLVGADWIFLLSLSILLTNFIRDGCRVKFCFPLEGKRFFEHCSLEGMDSERGGGQGVEGFSSFVSKKEKKTQKVNTHHMQIQ